MHFTISPFGSAGDVHPFLGLALKLRDRAHDVPFVTTGYFEETVRRHGLEYVELGTKKEFLEAVDNPDLWSQSKSFARVFNSAYYDQHVAESSIELLGHSVGGVTYRHYAHGVPLAFKAIMTLPQPSAFAALVKGYDGECPCCRRRFADGS